MKFSNHTELRDDRIKSSMAGKASSPSRKMRVSVTGWAGAEARRDISAIPSGLNSGTDGKVLMQRPMTIIRIIHLASLSRRALPVCQKGPSR
jgi:hypothetical protein